MEMKILGGTKLSRFIPLMLIISFINHSKAPKWLFGGNNGVFAFSRPITQPSKPKSVVCRIRPNVQRFDGPPESFLSSHDDTAGKDVEDAKLWIGDEVFMQREEDDDFESELVVDEDQSEIDHQSVKTIMELGTERAIGDTSSQDENKTKHYEGNNPYLYLQNEVGIPDDVMLKISLAAGHVFTLSAANMRHKIQLLQSFMELTDAEVRTLVSRQPIILKYSANQNIAPTLLFLQRSLDLSRQDLKKILVPYPTIIGYALPNLKAKISFFIERLGFTVSEARQLFCKEPRLLTTSVTQSLIPRADFFLREIRFDLETFRSLLLKHPTLLLMSRDFNLRRKLVKFAFMALQLSRAEIRTMLKRDLTVLKRSLYCQLLPVTCYLLQDLKFRICDVRSILIRFPRFFGSSLPRIQSIVEYLESEMGMDEYQIRTILSRAPRIVSRQAEGCIQNRVEFFQNYLQGSNFTRDEVGGLLAVTPALFLSSEKNIHPKMEYLRMEFEKDVAQGICLDARVALKEAILRLPPLLEYSLSNRIQPRMERIREMDLPASTITVGITLKEDNFQRWLSRKVAAKQQEQVESTRKFLTEEKSQGDDILR